MKGKSPILPVLIGALAVGLVAVGLNPASDSDTKKPSGGPEAQVTAVQGRFRRANDRAEAVLAVKALRPGQAATGIVRVGNAGTSPGLFTLSHTAVKDDSGRNGGRLSERLKLKVLDVTDSESPNLVYTGGVAALDARPLGVLSPGASRRYRVEATVLKSEAAKAPPLGGASLKGSSTEVSLRWAAIEGLPSTRLPALLSPFDGTGPQLRLVVAPRQAVIGSGRLKASLRCSEPCRASGTAAVPVGARRRLDLRLAKDARRAHPLVLSFPRRTQNALRGALVAGRTVAMTIRVETTDRSGNRSTLTETVRLRPGR